LASADTDRLAALVTALTLAELREALRTAVGLSTIRPLTDPHRRHGVASGRSVRAGGVRSPDRQSELSRLRRAGLVPTSGPRPFASTFRSRMRHQPRSSAHCSKSASTPPS